MSDEQIERYRQWWQSRPWWERMLRTVTWYVWGQFVFVWLWRNVGERACPMCDGFGFLALDRARGEKTNG